MIWADQMRMLLIDARDTLISTAPSSALPVQPTTLFSTPQLLFSTIPFSSLTPKIDRVRSVTPSAGVMTFTRPLNFLDIQSSFNHIFGTPPHDSYFPYSKRKHASEDPEYLASKALAFCNLYRLHIFCDSNQLKYVGTSSYDSQQMFADICFLCKLQIIVRHVGKLFSSTPDELFIRYTKFLSLLSPNTLT